MAEVSDLHVGKQLSVVYTPQGLNATVGFTQPYLTGAAAIPGTGHFNGSVLIGSGKFFPPKHTASLMVTRPSPDENPLAAIAPSIVHIRGLPPPLSTPIDVVIGDPAGPVGLTLATTIVLEINMVSKKTISPLDLKIVKLMKKLGVQVDTGATVETGAQAQAGAEVRASAKALAGPVKVSAPCAAPIFKGAIFTGTSLGNKKFDISHPTKKGHRLSHVCLEGPTSDVYVRGRLKDKNVIELPEYWNGLVDSDGITVQLQPIGDRHLHLNITEVDNQKIVINEADNKPIDCFYHVYGERKDIEKNIAEYEGESPADYPGDLKHSSIAGYTYDTERN